MARTLLNLTQQLWFRKEERSSSKIVPFVMAATLAEARPGRI